MLKAAFLSATLGIVVAALVSAQPNRLYYADYAVAGSGYFCWTQWLDRDDASGTGDYETLAEMPQSKVCSRPVGIQCETARKQKSDLSGKFITRCTVVSSCMKSKFACHQLLRLFSHMNIPVLV